MDVLVTLVLAVFLLAVVSPLVSEPSAQASRVVCRANLAKIGKATLIYAGDYDNALPRAGGPESTWSGPVAWTAMDRYGAFGIGADGKGGSATISSCFYLLVKYMEVPPRLFVCPSDRGTHEFKLSDEGFVGTSFELIDAWDFGMRAHMHCSYSYHIPFGQYALKTSCDPNLPVAADRNPWIPSPAGEVVMENWTNFWPDTALYAGTIEVARLGNAITHANDGQNVLFLDGRVTFETRSYCGVGNDNIYTVSGMYKGGDAKGYVPMLYSACQPRCEIDSVLVHDPPIFPGPRSRN